MKTPKEVHIPVIFRAFKKGGEVISLFPTLPANMSPSRDCMSYMHVGQHGAASAYLSSVTRPATAFEAAPLASELERIGYSLAPCKRFTPAHHRARIAAI